MTERDPSLPDFENPPVEETALSLQFAPIPKFGIPHFGLYWAGIRDRFPRFEVHGPISSVTEQYEPIIGASMRIQVSNAPELRCWFLDETGTRLVQVQRDRFVHNWRRVKGDEKYPRYENIRETLRSEWRSFCAFLQQHGMSEPEVNQCEVTYVNHIEYEKGWSGYSELNKVIAVWSGTGSSGFLPAPERASIRTSYLLPGKLGRLHLSLTPVVRARDAQEVLQLTLVARGLPSSTGTDALFSWFDLAREWVVKGFADITAETMHKTWGRIR